MANKSLPYESQNASAQAGHVSRLFSLPGGGRPRCRRSNIWDTTARVPPSLRHVVPEPSLIASKRDGKYEITHAKRRRNIHEEIIYFVWHRGGRRCCRADWNCAGEGGQSEEDSDRENERSRLHVGGERDLQGNAARRIDGSGVGRSGERRARHVHQIRAGVRRQDAHAHERCLAGRAQGSVSLPR